MLAKAYFKLLVAEQKTELLSLPSDPHEALARLQALEETGGDGGADEGEDEMMCPVSLELMSDPVETESRKVYDRHTIEAWFATCRAKGEPLTDPMTKEELPSAKLRPKQALKERIRKYLKRHPERRPQWA